LQGITQVVSNFPKQYKKPSSKALLFFLSLSFHSLSDLNLKGLLELALKESDLNLKGLLELALKE